MSILAFYAALFDCAASFRFAQRLVTVLCLMWWVAITALTVFQCHPIEETFDRLRLFKVHCVKLVDMILCGELSTSMDDQANASGDNAKVVHRNNIPTRELVGLFHSQISP